MEICKRTTLTYGKKLLKLSENFKGNMQWSHQNGHMSSV